MHNLKYQSFDVQIGCSLPNQPSHSSVIVSPNKITNQKQENTSTTATLLTIGFELMSIGAGSKCLLTQFLEFVCQINVFVLGHELQWSQNNVLS